MTYFVISLGAITLALIGICSANYCGCGPKARRAQRERAEFNRHVKVMELRHLQHMQEMTEAQDRLQTLSALQEKRRLEHPYPQRGVENGGADFGVSTLGGDVVDISTATSDTAATTSGVDSGKEEGGRDTHRDTHRNGGFIGGFNYSY